MKKILVSLAGLMVLLVPLGAHADTILNFDDVVNGTIINTHYLGVTLSNPLGGDIYARNPALISDTSQVVSIYSLAENPNGAFNASDGAVDVLFATAQGRVSIDARAFRNSGDALDQSTLNPFLEIYALVSGSFVEIAQIDYSEALGSGEVGPWETLSFTSATNNIAMVRFSSQYANNAGTVPFGEFDNLTFAARDLASGQFLSTADVINPTEDGGGGDTGGGGGSTTVPEPGTLALFATAMAFGWPAFRKRKS